MFRAKPARASTSPHALHHISDSAIHPATHPPTAAQNLIRMNPPRLTPIESHCFKKSRSNPFRITLFHKHPGGWARHPLLMAVFVVDASAVLTWCIKASRRSRRRTILGTVVIPRQDGQLRTLTACLSRRAEHRKCGSSAEHKMGGIPHRTIKTIWKKENESEDCRRRDAEGEFSLRKAPRDRSLLVATCGYL
jgi:hypothetical protein